MKNWATARRARDDEWLAVHFHAACREVALEVVHDASRLLPWDDLPEPQRQWWRRVAGAIRHTAIRDDRLVRTVPATSTYGGMREGPEGM